MVHPPAHAPVHDVRRYMQRNASLGRATLPIVRPQ